MAVYIVSKTNGLVKKIRKLRDRKYRESFGEYVAEGRRWVTDAVRLCPQNVVAVVCSDAAPHDAADYVLPAAIFDTLAQTENSQGILAIMRIPSEASTFAGDFCLFLDRVRDPGNMGTIVRTACAAGYTDIVLRDCVDVYNPKVIRSSMTGVLGVRFHYADSLQSVTSAGFVSLAATLGGTNVYASDIPHGKLCLVIGSESEGIGADILASCAAEITIPMQSDMESLNAAVSAGILMYTLKYGNRYKE